MRRRFRRRRTSTCGKRRFADEYEAEHALAWTRHRAAAEARRPPVRVYECSRCGGWHLTSRPLM